MAPGTKTIERQFRFSTELAITEELSLAQTWLEEVIDGIEKDELLVFPADKEADLQSLQADGSILLNAGATEPVSIREWICVGCQRIRWGDLGEFIEQEDCIAAYRSNGHKVLLPPAATGKPVGPAGFLAEIVLNPGIMQWVAAGDDESEAKFKFVIAHELVHVFDNMRLLVPAFRDWESFWDVVLHQGTACDIVLNLQFDVDRFVDSYGEESELAMVREYWPSQADAWFGSMHM